MASAPGVSGGQHGVGEDDGAVGEDYAIGAVGLYAALAVLLGVQPSIDASTAQQVLVGAVVVDPACVDHVDDVGGQDGR